MIGFNERHHYEQEEIKKSKRKYFQAKEDAEKNAKDLVERMMDPQFKDGQPVEKNVPSHEKFKMLSEVIHHSKSSDCHEYFINSN